MESDTTLQLRVHMVNCSNVLPRETHFVASSCDAGDDVARLAHSGSHRPRGADNYMSVTVCKLRNRGLGVNDEKFGIHAKIAAVYVSLSERA